MDAGRSELCRRHVFLRAVLFCGQGEHRGHLPAGHEGEKHRDHTSSQGIHVDQQVADQHLGGGELPHGKLSVRHQESGGDEQPAVAGDLPERCGFVLPPGECVGPALSNSGIHAGQCIGSFKEIGAVAGGSQMGKIVRDVLNPPENIVVEPGHLQSDEEAAAPEEGQ